MNRDETKQILMRIQSTFPNWKPQSDLRFVVEAWHEYLSDYNYDQVRAALKAFVLSDVGGFGPNPGQLIGMIDRLGNSEELNEMEAWSLVSKALRNGYYGAEQEFEKLPPIVQKTVGSPSQLRNWSQTDSDSVENVIQSNFMRTYRQELAKNREIRKIPQDTRLALEQSKNMLIEDK